MNKSKFISILWISLCFLLPSLRFIQKYSGITGCFVIALGIFLFVYLAVFSIDKIPYSRHLNWGYIIVFALIVLIFFVVYPIANSGAYGGIGSDRDDAINIGVSRLVTGQYPYYAKTYLGNPLSPLPGAFLLASPFVLLLGNSAYQNLFWLPIFFLLSRSLLRNEPANLVLMVVTLLGCPMIMHEVVHGGDLLSNSIYCLVAICLFRLTFDTRNSEWRKVLAAIFLGISFASRFNFLFLFPLVFLSVAKSKLKDAVLFTGIAIFMFLLLTLPFYLYDPVSFSPLSLTTSHISSRISTFIPAWIIPFVTLTISCFMGLRYQVEKLGNLLYCCSVVQMFPIVSVTLLQSLKSNQIDFGSDGFGTTGYGLVFLFFGVLSMGIRIFQIQTEK
jgi:hypothetical protein